MCLMKILLYLMTGITAFLEAGAQSGQYPGAPLLAGQGAYSEKFIDPFSFLRIRQHWRVVQKPAPGFMSKIDSD